MRTIIIYAAVFVAVFMLALSVAHAAPGGTTGFASEPETKHIVSCSGALASDGMPSCDFCSFVEMLSNLVRYAAFTAIVISSLSFSYAGFLYLTNNGNKTQVQRAHRMIGYTFGGIIAMLGAYLVVDMIMTKLANDPQWRKLSCKEQISPQSSGGTVPLYIHNDNTPQGTVIPGNEFNPNTNDNVGGVPATQAGGDTFNVMGQ